jgi:hypothetical protein
MRQAEIVYNNLVWQTQDGRPYHKTERAGSISQVRYPMSSKIPDTEQSARYQAKSFYLLSFTLIAFLQTGF